MGKSIKPDERHVLTVEVRATKAISPTFVRVTVGGQAVEQFAYMGYNPTANVDWHLLVGDESALPAIVGILQSAPRDLQAEAYIEIPHADDAQEIDAPAGANVHWLVRTDRAAKPGAQALDTVRAAQLRDGRMYAFVAGEQKLASGIRRHLINDRKVPKHDVTFTGYWR